MMRIPFAEKCNIRIFQAAAVDLRNACLEPVLLMLIFDHAGRGIVFIRIECCGIRIYALLHLRRCFTAAVRIEFRPVQRQDRVGLIALGDQKPVEFVILFGILKPELRKDAVEIFSAEIHFSAATALCSSVSFVRLISPKSVTLHITFWH